MDMRIKCPNCGAEFEAPDQSYYVICPYCGITLRRVKGIGFKPETGHYYYPVNQRDPYHELVRFIYSNAPVPDDFIDSADLRDRKLYYIPMYSYYVEGEVTIYGLREIITTYRYGEYVAVPAVDAGVVTKLLAPWNTALEGKKPFDPRIKSMGKYYEPEIHPYDASWFAELVYKWWSRIRVWRELGRIYGVDASISMTRYTGLIHYPVWEIRYHYSGRDYKAYVDGVDNRVILAESPGSFRKNLVLISYIALLSLAIAYGSYFTLSNIGLLEKLRGIASASVLAISLIPVSTLISKMKRVTYLSNSWSEEEIIDMIKVFLEFPF